MKGYTPPDIARRIMLQNTMLKILMLLVVFTLFVLYFINQYLLQKPVLVVDRAGSVLGLVDLNNAALRSEEEIVADLSRFLSWYHSNNSVTIDNDMRLYLPLLTDEARQKRLEYLRESGLYALVAQGNYFSSLTIKKTTIKKQGGFNGGQWQARVVAKLTIQSDSGQTQHTDVTNILRFRLTARTVANSLGLYDVALD